jgi:hypothetical protein
MCVKNTLAHGPIITPDDWLTRLEVSRTIKTNLNVWDYIEKSADTSLGGHALTFALNKAIQQIGLVTSWTKRIAVT